MAARITRGLRSEFLLTTVAVLLLLVIRNGEY